MSMYLHVDVARHALRRRVQPSLLVITQGKCNPHYSVQSFLQPLGVSKDVELDSVCPQALEVVKLTGVSTHEVHDNIAIVNEHPAL